MTHNLQEENIAVPRRDPLPHHIKAACPAGPPVAAVPNIAANPVMPLQGHRANCTRSKDPVLCCMFPAAYHQHMHQAQALNLACRETITGFTAQLHKAQADLMQARHQLQRRTDVEKQLGELQAAGNRLRDELAQQQGAQQPLLDKLHTYQR